MLRKGLSQEALGAALGVSHAAVSGWLSGAVPRQSKIKQLADFFGISVDTLLAEQGNPTITREQGRTPRSHPLPRPGLTTEQMQSVFVALRRSAETHKETLQAIDASLENAAEFFAKANLPPEWWPKVPPPEKWEELETVLPHVYERLVKAAELLLAGDEKATRREPRLPEEITPLIDAFSDLDLQGTGFTSTPGGETLFRAYTQICTRLRFPELFKKRK